MEHKIFKLKNELCFQGRLPHSEKISSEEKSGKHFLLFPYLEPGSYVHESAVLIGGIFVSKKCFIGPYAVLRMDEEFRINGLLIEEGSNIQDHVVIHAAGNKIGKNCNIAHHAIIHGAIIGDKTTIYMKSCVEHAVIGKNCFIDVGCYIRNVVVPDQSYIPPGTVITCKKDLRKIQSNSEEFLKIHKKVNQLNLQHAEKYCTEHLKVAS